MSPRFSSSTLFSSLGYSLYSITLASTNPSTMSAPGAGHQFPSQEVSWLKRDALLFANSIGCTADELHFLFVSRIPVQNGLFLMSCLVCRNFIPTLRFSRLILSSSVCCTLDSSGEFTNRNRCNSIQTYRPRSHGLLRPPEAHSGPGGSAIRHPSRGGRPAQAYGLEAAPAGEYGQEVRAAE